MLTLRRGIARVGWVLLTLWIIVWVAIVVEGRVESNPPPPPLDATVVLQLAALVLGWSLVIFLLWRLLLWIAQGFWQHKAPAKPHPVAVHAGNKSALMDEEKPWGPFEASIAEMPATPGRTDSACLASPFLL